MSSRGSATSGRSYCIHRFRQKPVTFRLSLPTAVATARTLEQADTQRGSSCPGWVGGKAKAQSAVLAQLPISDCLIPNGRLRGALNDQCTPMPAKLNTCIHSSATTKTTSYSAAPRSFSPSCRARYNHLRRT